MHETSAEQRAIAYIQAQGGIVRTGQAIASGIHPRVLYALRDQGRLECLSRGVYRLTDGMGPINPDLTVVAKRIPRAIVCLVSSLAFHDLTTQIPHRISIALPIGAKTPRLDYPPLEVHRFSIASYEAGVEKQKVDGVDLSVFDPEKTLADCFKFRNTLGMDLVLEALKLYQTRRSIKVKRLVEYARICRVESVMRPYLEALL